MVDWRQSKFEDKRFYLIGPFDPYVPNEREEDVRNFISCEAGEIATLLDDSVTYVVIGRHSAKTEVAEAKRRIAAGAPTKILTVEQLQDLVIPSEEHVSAMLHAGAEGIARLNERIQLAGLLTDNLRYQVRYTVKDLDLTGQDLSTLPLFCIELCDCNLSHSRLPVNNFPKVYKLVRCKLDHASWRARIGSIEDCSAIGADFTHSHFGGYSRERMNGDFRHANFTLCNFNNLDLSHSDFSDACLTESRFYECVASNAQFCRADLRRFYGWSDTAFKDCNFSSANLEFATFPHVSLEGCDLRGANARNAFFAGASLKDALVADADFTGSKFLRTNLEGVDVSHARGVVSNENSLPTPGPLLSRLLAGMKVQADYAFQISAKSGSDPIHLGIYSKPISVSKTKQCGWGFWGLWHGTTVQWASDFATLEEALLNLSQMFAKLELRYDTVEVTSKNSDWSDEYFARRMLEVLGELFGIHVPTPGELVNERRRFIRNTLMEGEDVTKNEVLRVLLSELKSSLIVPDLDLRSKVLDDIQFRYVGFKNANFNGASLKGVSFRKTNCSHSSFQSASLAKAEFLSVNLSNCDFTGADFSKAMCNGCDFTNANFTRADLTTASLDVTNLAGANFTDAKMPTDLNFLEHASFDSATVFPEGFQIPDNMIWGDGGVSPRVKDEVEKLLNQEHVSIRDFIQIVRLAYWNDEALKVAIRLLKKHPMKVYAERTVDGVRGIVQNTARENSVLACQLTAIGKYQCVGKSGRKCSEEVIGFPCCHLILFAIVLVQTNLLDGRFAAEWIIASHRQPQSADPTWRELMLRFRDAKAGKAAWDSIVTDPKEFKNF